MAGRRRSDRALRSVNQHRSGTPAMTASKLLRVLGNMARRWGSNRRRSVPHPKEFQLTITATCVRFRGGGHLGAVAQPQGSRQPLASK